MLIQGADFIDVGGYSTRPNAAEVSEEEELARVIPVVRQLMKTFPNMLLSIDTFRSEVARQAVAEGAAIINDISAGGLDPQMLKVVAEAQVPYIAMHYRGGLQPRQCSSTTDYNYIITDMLLLFFGAQDCYDGNGH